MKNKFKIGEEVVTEFNETVLIVGCYQEKITKSYCYVVETEELDILMFSELQLKKINELKPCPFCGNKNVVFTDNKYETLVSKEDAKYIVCDAQRSGCGVSSGHIYNDVDKKIENWNNAKR